MRLSPPIPRPCTVTAPSGQQKPSEILQAVNTPKPIQLALAVASRRLALFGALLLVLFVSAASGSGCNYPTADSWLQPPDLGVFSVVATALPVADITMPQPLNPVIQVSFSDYPDPNTISYPALQLGLQEEAIEYTVEISLVAKQIAVHPVQQLLPETQYTLSLAPDIYSLAGVSLGAASPGSVGSPFFLTFFTGSEVLPSTPLPPPVSLASLLASGGPLGSGCAMGGCHTSAGGAQPASGLDFLASPAAVAMQLAGGERGGLDNLLLVDPGRPELSYLLRKLLAASPGGFLRIDGDPMPPPASAAPPLDTAALTAVETWIRQGAN
jgi:hypothetical protein